MVTRRRFLALAGAAVAGAAGWYVGRTERQDASAGAGTLKTWLLVDATSPSNVPVAQVTAAFDRADIAGISLAQPWDAVETAKGIYDFATAEAVATLAASLGAEFSLRIRGGAHTPTFRMGRTFIPKTEQGLVIPCPFNVDGTKNATLLAGVRALATQVGKRAYNLAATLVHGTWPGGKSAELYYTDEMLTLEGHSASVMASVHADFLTAWQSRIPVTIPIEMPFGGVSGAPYAGLQRFIYDQMHASDRAQFIQLNWLDDRSGDDTLTNFATRWPLPPRHGLQMIHAITMDYAKAFDRARRSGAEYVEVYLKQFALAGSDQLVQEIDAG